MENARAFDVGGFVRIKGISDAVEAVYSSDEAKRRFEILARHEPFARRL
jgi:hypothetical protein